MEFGIWSFNTLSLVLHARGQVEIGGTEELESRLGTTSFRVRWRQIELWKQSAKDLFAMNEVGLIPWVPLTKFEEPPEAILQECRNRIDAGAMDAERDNLLAVAQIMTQLRYDDERYLAFFGGKKSMIESPLIQELQAEARMEARHADILRVLATRFGSAPNDIGVRVKQMLDDEVLDQLIEAAVRCPDVDVFRDQLRDFGKP